MTEAGPDRAEMEQAHRVATEAAARLGLVFGQHHGRAGRWLGPGIGSSIEYADHRPFNPGDDPRYLDWAAFARSEQWISKVYREEVSPQIDVVIDVSRSMFLGERKRRRSLELAYYVVLAANELGAGAALYTVAGANARRHPIDAFVGHRWLDATPEGVTPDLARVPWRPRSMRVLISDLLFAGAPDGFVRPLASGAGRAVLLAPFDPEEANPPWLGACRLVDCETNSARILDIDDETIARYREAYGRHFTMWSEACQKASVAFARVASPGTLVASLEAQALAAEAVAPWT